MERWLEDFTPGLVIESGGATLTESAIVDFALQWDAQPFHIDAPAAADSPFGGLIASGFHTLVVAFKLLLAEQGVRRSSIGSPGIEDLRWLKPVRPGDTLRARMEVLENTPSRSKPDRGVIRVTAQAFTQSGDEVLRYTYAHMLLKRPA